MADEADMEDSSSRPHGEVSVVAVPLANKKLCKKLYKLSKKAAASKILKRGVKEVVKALRKGDSFKGCVWCFAARPRTRAATLGSVFLSRAPRACAASSRVSCPTLPKRLLSDRKRRLCIIAGDISPIDVISHLPVLCEDKAVPFIFVPSKVELGAAAGTKRPTSCVLIPLGAKPGKGGVDFDAADKLKECMDEVRAATPVQ